MILHNQISQWLADYLETANLQTFVVGVSGGIDSALVSTLCAETGKRTIVVSMPIHQAEDQLERANRHIQWLESKYPNVESITKDLSSLFNNFRSLFELLENDLALANSRSRLRMVTLYQIAGINNGLVVGTGNKVEDFGIGFFTKYGDGGVDISPIGDLTKSEVRDLAQELGILEEIIVAVPTDGLWEDNRTDEDQIGATYDELEWAMNHTGSPDFLEGRAKEVYTRFVDLNNRNKHKILPVPVYKKEYMLPLFNYIAQKKYEADGGDNILLTTYPITEDWIVVDIGAYTGNWAKQIVDTYNPTMYLVEPITTNWTYLQDTYRSNPKIHIVCNGISDCEKDELLYINACSTSKYTTSTYSEVVKFITFDKFIEEYNINTIDLLQINIEGEEYSLLEHMISTGSIKKVKNFHVQFHKFFVDSKQRRDSIRDKLLKLGFVNNWTYEFVWESWSNLNII